MRWAKLSIAIPSVRVGDGTAPAGRADKTATGLFDRLLVGHSARPVRCRVSGRARPTDHYQDSVRVSRKLGSDLARALTRTLTTPRSRVVDQRSSDPRCRLSRWLRRRAGAGR